MRYFLSFLTILLIASCVPPSEIDELEINVDFGQQSQQAIFDAKEQSDTEQLRSFFSSENVTERYLAVMASGSLKDSTLCEPLINILNNDPSQEVRKTAAYTLGQIGSSYMLDELIQSFLNQDTSNYNNKVRGAILEAVGKCGNEQSLQHIATISTYKESDTHLLLGQARAIYRYGLRRMYSEEGTRTMIAILLNRSIADQVRLIAAHYLLRNPSVDISEFQSRLNLVLVSEEDSDIRMALAGALTSRGSIDQAPVLLSMLSSDPDHRVKINIMRSLPSYDYPVYRDSLLTFLNDPDDQMFDLATNIFLANLPQREHTDFLALARAESIPRRKAKLYAIALNAIPSGFINTRRAITGEMAQNLSTAVNYLDKVAFINALSYDPLNLAIINEEGLQSTENFVRTSSINSIKNLITNRRTQGVFRRPSALNSFRSSIATHLKDVLNNGDPGSVAAIATLARDESCGFKNEAGLNLSIRSAMRKLNLPEDYEARRECLLTLGYLEDTTFQIDPLAYNHPIDWDIIADISDSSRAYIITTKGQIELQLLKNQSPGSVSNFVSLSQSNFYDGKTIHRVVPNFVIQGGCPRGDGYGSLDYTIRSDLGPNYYDKEGYIGMASAGPNTEGTQWFITHSPTPHLDGRYSIFGRVTDGMDVVHDIRQGDVIQDVRILKL